MATSPSSFKDNLTGVVYERGEEHGAAGGEGAPRPPEVERRGVAVADRLLPRRLPVDRLQRQRDLDQLPLVGHAGKLVPLQATCTLLGGAA